MPLTFTVTDEQLMKLTEWYEDLIPEICRIQGRTLEEGPYYGAIGGGTTYRFLPTGLGVALVVTETVTGKEINVTDYDSW